MGASVVVDTGPIVAMLDADEANHNWVMSQVERLRPPLVTCEAVLAEAAFLVSRAGAHSNIVPQLVTRGFVTVAKLFDDDAAEIVRLMARYRNVPMSLTDACLVRLVERTPNATLFTLDSELALAPSRSGSAGASPACLPLSRHPDLTLSRHPGVSSGYCLASRFTLLKN